MGGLYSRIFRKQTTREQLEVIEKRIKNIHEFRIHTQQRQRRFVGSLIAYSVVLYVVAAIIFYFYYFPNELSKQILYSLPLVLFPLLVWLLKELVHWYYQRKLKNNESQLTELLQKKRKLLDEVMEKETYKVAHEILEKFDPDQLRKNSGKEKDALAGPPDSGAPGPPMPRPILPRERTFFDKLIEYLVGDGPSTRFALICRQCQSHNGMALQEEFEFIAFRCCYCYYWNPARKQRPSAPRLPDYSGAIGASPPLKHDESKAEENEASQEEGETEEEELSSESEKKEGEVETEIGAGEKPTENTEQPQTKEVVSQVEAKAI